MTRVIDLQHYADGSLPEGFRQMLIDVHADAYADAMGDEFHQRFPWFVDHWSQTKGFTCVVAYDGDEPTGFAYGAPQRPGREWWRSTTFEAVAETPRRTRSPRSWSARGGGSRASRTACMKRC